MLRSSAPPVVVGLCVAALAGAALAQAPTAAYDPVVFELVKGSGVDFVTDSGRTPHRHQPETMVAGVALLDYDNDGRLDIYLTNGASMTELDKSQPRYWNRLYHNLGNWKFEDVTEKAGVKGNGYDLGVAVADYDNDGWPDILVLGLRRNTLYHNNGDGTFSDVSERAGLNKADPQYGTLWSVAAAFFDYDNDGKLDLFVSNYCVWDPKTEPLCGPRGMNDYCHPNNYKGLPNSLYRNNGDGTFTDVSASSGIRKVIGKGMGIGLADYDGDGYLDLFVANDTEPNYLFHNLGNGTFEEVGFMAGVGYPEAGKALSGMGADARDIDDDGRPDIFHTALSSETMPVFRNQGKLNFIEVTAKAGVSSLSLSRAGWSNGIVDFNNDGRKDLFVAGGDVMDPTGEFKEKVRQTNLVMANLGGFRFADATAGAGPEFSSKRATHRGAAFGDIDNDGRVDAVVTALDEGVELWRNVSPIPNHWLSVRAVGSRSNRDGIGADIAVTTPSGVRHDHVNGAVGYGCASDLRVHFGLGQDELVTTLEVRWPSGIRQVLENVKADQLLTVREPER
ncbi:MAG TPA: CRTAC1 family protein [Vicinamibacteria bacterium]|nr:CRTAC1 family protein [Vicinamibacteria bacterium]